MTITVILCTFNRCQSLAVTLESLAAQIVPERNTWNVLVVDNNSKDQTREVVEAFSKKYPGRFQYLFEGQQGLSHARNTGIREAHGDVLVFVDDDVTVDPSWLQNLTATFNDPACSGVGGRIVPDWQCTRPKWLASENRYALAPLAIFDLGPEEHELTEPPFGTNMAFRKEMFDKYGAFRVDLGRRGNSLISNEDTEFGGRLLQAGEKMHYVPTAIVHHPVTEDRVQKSYFLAWWFNKARGEIREFGILPNTRLFVGGVPVYIFRRFFVWALRWMIAIEPSRRFDNKIKLWAKMGEIAEMRNQAKKKKASSPTNSVVASGKKSGVFEKDSNKI
jgi:glucosyl-dolichyl phosphate glucuronosyltransferase